ncbi:hypothetical protein GTID1_13185 [Geobacillus thermodenitrificans]|uniref:hypothetical protein n=1 Tax=Geobacillus thermodenitrificans TaxID=33940 RepID=UPI000C05C130|nr:hypothetical protein [Geobacillus thermodenitrificans]ATO38049.1 hypothetical protein GTID1_13185 [Geobacillus thermodenitrificans]
MFIKCYNSFADYSSQYKLTQDEFYIYCYLYTNRTYEEYVLTSVDLIHQTLNISFSNKESSNKKIIMNCLLNLKQKGIISFEADQFKNNTALHITFNEIEAKGYEGISYEKFRSFKNATDCYIYFCVARYQKLNGFEASYNDWASVLNVSRKTAIEIIEDVCKRGIIYKEIGGYTDEEIRSNQKKQEKNRYYIQKVEQKENVANKSATSSKENVKTVQENNTTNTNNEQEQREHNWYVKGSELTVDDFYIYLTTNDEKLKKQAEFRINAISKNEKGKYIVESLMKEAQEKVKDEKRKAEQEMLKQMTNAVRLKDGTIVAVDEKNIDSIDVNEVEHIFYSYYGQHLEGYGEIEGFQTGKLINGKFVHDDRPDMIQRGWELYKQHVKTGEMLSGDKIRSIKDTVVNEFFPNLKDETETRITWKKKKDETDISEFVKEEKKKKREIIDIAAIVVEDWELDEKKREDEQKEQQDRQSRLLQFLDEMEKKRKVYNDDDDLSFLDELD